MLNLVNLLSLVKLWTNLSSQQKIFGQTQQTQQKMFFGQIFAEFAGFDQKFVEFVTTLITAFKTKEKIIIKEKERNQCES